MGNLPSLSPLALSLILAFASTAASAQSPPAPQLAFEPSAVVASGLTPGKMVIWFGVEHRIDAEYSNDIRQHYEVGMAAADGTARLDLTLPVAPRSFWVAVDLDSGQFALAGANGYRLARPQTPSALDPGVGALPDAIVDQRPYLIGLVVRPGVGAWSFAGGDGGQRDLDGAADGHLRFGLDQFDPLPGSPAAPAKLQAGDLWFIVEPLAMQIEVHKGGVEQ